jgi:hypothetical protein
LRRALSFSLGFMALAIALAVVRLWPAASRAFGWRLELVQFALGAAAAAAAAAIASWATAIFIACEHRVTWPFMLLTGLVVVASGGFALRCYKNASLAARFA